MTQILYYWCQFARFLRMILGKKIPQWGAGVEVTLPSAIGPQHQRLVLAPVTLFWGLLSARGRSVVGGRLPPKPGPNRQGTGLKNKDPALTSLMKVILRRAVSWVPGPQRLWGSFAHCGSISLIPPFLRPFPLPHFSLSCLGFLG